jgi:threonine synthase
MKFVSTRGAGSSADLRTAVLGGLAPDGGLYLPEQVPLLPESFFARLGGTSLGETAVAVLHPYLEELAEPDLRGLVNDVFSFDIPLVRLGSDVRVLELFHGPTLAFKDVGARFLARLVSRCLRDADDRSTVLVATSGDTGSAVARAFLGVPRTRVVVLYPEGQVSPVQQKQFTTLGDNVRALAVAGTFDDCQRLVKEAFADDELRRTVRPISANSINIGRLLPQIVYYFHAVAQLPAGEPPVLFATPSGNFGNLCAGLIAKRMGLPVSGFVAATNVNDVVPVYLETGEFRPRSSRRTISSAMDVGDPSNFDRIRFLYGDDRTAIRRDLTGRRYDDDETRTASREVRSRYGYTLDPHTAVGYLGLRAVMETHGDVTGVVLATAHPAKFRDEVEPEIGESVELPARLAECLEREDRSTRMAPELAALRIVLTETA